MDDIKDLLGSAGVPERDPDYWRSFAGRVKDSCPAASAKRAGRALNRRFTAFLAGAAALLAIAATAVWFLPPAGKPPVPPEPPVTNGDPDLRPGSAPAMEARRTAKLAGLADAGVLGVLQEAASEKALGAERALDRRDIDALAPLARSYAKILREGLQPRLNRAVESGEDLSPWIPAIQSALEADEATWRRLCAKTGDAVVCREMTGACDATLDVRKLLEEEFPIGRN